MMLRPFRLERELDRAVAQWLGWLPRWDPMASPGRTGVCASCLRWTEPLGLESVPHGPVHALVTSVDALVTGYFHRCAEAQYPGIGHTWRVTLDDGEVCIAPAAPSAVLSDTEAAEATEADGATPHLTVAEAFVARMDLTRLYESIVEEAAVRIRTHRDDMLHLIGITVERRVQRMVDELSADLSSRDIA